MPKKPLLFDDGHPLILGTMVLHLALFILGLWGFEKPSIEKGIQTSRDPVIVIAGDIASTWTTNTLTADLITQIRPTLAGKHDHATTKLGGYCSYFGEVAHCQDGYSYYSYDVGAWHIIALDSGCMNPSSCPDPTAKGSAMRTWLTADLAAHTNRCTLAYWHHPLFTSSKRHAGEKRLTILWTERYEAGVDIVVNGHVHMYERFAPQDPMGRPDPAHGIVEFVASTRGMSSCR